MSDIVIYKDKNGEVEVEVKLEDETLWLSQKQIAELFGVSIPTINKHIKNIYKEEELSKDSTIRKFLIVRQEGKRRVKREIEHYNLDLIISVGYRVKSKVATKFRQWATKVLKSYIIKGYALNQEKIKQRFSEFEKEIELLTKVIENNKLQELEAKGFLEIITKYTKSWILLN